MWAGVRECKGRASTASNEIVWVCPRVNMSLPTHTTTQTPTRTCTHRHGTDIGDTCRVAPTKTSSGRQRERATQPIHLDHGHCTATAVKHTCPHRTPCLTSPTPTRAEQCRAGGGTGTMGTGQPPRTAQGRGRGRRGRARSAGQTQRSHRRRHSLPRALWPLGYRVSWPRLASFTMHPMQSHVCRVRASSGGGQWVWRRPNVGKDHRLYRVGVYVC
jgi:hypothetical protein